MKIEKNEVFPRKDKLKSGAEKERRPTLKVYIRGAKARNVMMIP